MHAPYPRTTQRTFIDTATGPQVYWTAHSNGFDASGPTEQEAVDNLCKIVLENIFPVAYVISDQLGSEPRQYCWCPACALPCDKALPVPAEYVPLYRVNVGIYSQVCDSCGKLIVDGVKRSSKDKKIDGKPLCLFGLTAS